MEKITDTFLQDNVDYHFLYVFFQQKYAHYLSFWHM